MPRSEPSRLSECALPPAARDAAMLALRPAPNPGGTRSCRSLDYLPRSWHQRNMPPLEILPLQGFEWGQVQTPAVEVNSCLEVLGVAEARRCLLHPLYGRVHGFEARLGAPMAMVRQGVRQMAPDHPGHLRHRLEPAVGGAPEPAREEPLGRTPVRVLPEVAEAFFERPGAPDLEITAQ